MLGGYSEASGKLHFSGGKCILFFRWCKVGNSGRKIMVSYTTNLFIDGSLEFQAAVEN
jgi:hypothetical protein